MPALSNPKQEAFCRAYVSGKAAGNATQAYRVAYGKENRSAAGKLLRRDHISRRCGELQANVAKIEATAMEIAAQELGITKTRILKELAKIGFGNMDDYTRVTDNGDIEVDMSRVDRDKMSNVQEVTIDSYQEGRGEARRTVKKVKFRLYDKQTALHMLGKHFALFVDVVKNPDVAEVMKQLVDRPPPETREQWVARRNKELAAEAVISKPAKVAKRTK